MDFDHPILITNFKAYPEAVGINAVNLAMEHERMANELGVNLAIAGQAVDLKSLAMSVSIPVLAQHVDAHGFGAHTGHIVADSLKPMGIDGSLLNHSEHRIPDEDIKAAMNRLKELKMFSVICAESVDEAVRFNEWDPDYIALEPPELIGGDVSISQSSPELIAQVVEKIGSNKVIVGAGVKNGLDVKRAVELGASGVLVASGVVRAQNHIEALRDLCAGFK